MNKVIHISIHVYVSIIQFIVDYSLSATESRLRDYVIAMESVRSSTFRKAVNIGFYNNTV